MSAQLQITEQTPFTKLFGSQRFEFLENEYFTRNENGVSIPEGIKKVGVNDSRLYIFINKLGYYGYEANGKPLLVKITNGKIIEEVSERQVIRQFHALIANKKFVYPYATSLDISQADHEKIINYFIRRESSLFSSNNLYRNLLPARDFVSHSQSAAFIFYSDKAAQVTAQGIEPVKYEDLPGYIWASQILPRPMPTTGHKGRRIWHQFIERISGRLDTANNWQPDPQRLKHLKSALGYLMHTHFEGKRRAVLLIDSAIDDDQGRTGKTLLGKGLINAIGPGVKELNGKEFDVRDPKRWRLCSLDTSTAIINDLRKYVPIDMFFNDITEGIQIHRNHEEPYNKDVKLLFTTNQSLKIDTPSAKDRFWPFELCQYYSEKLSPAQEFKCWFFSKDWSADDWADFDLFMLECLQAWFKNGFAKSESIALEEKTKRDHLDRDFLEFIEELTTTYNATTGEGNREITPVPSGQKFGDATEPLSKIAGYYLRLDKKAAFMQFVNEYGKNGAFKYGRNQELKSRTFYEWIRNYCTLTKGIVSNPNKAHRDKYGLEYKANGTQYILIAFE
jgi:hypothetical protein